MNRIRKKHFENIVMPREGRPQAQTTWEKRYAMTLVTICGLDLAVGAIRELKNTLKVSVHVEIVRIAIKEVGLGLVENVTMPIPRISKRG